MSVKGIIIRHQNGEKPDLGDLDQSTLVSAGQAGLSVSETAGDLLEFSQIIVSRFHTREWWRL